jgi:hypothetical protein
MSKTPAPKGLDTKGRAMWSSIVGKYELRADELAILEQACHLTEMAELLHASWVEQGKPLTTKGSMGQQVTHPLISEVKAHRTAAAGLMGRLKLPDEAEAPAKPANQARAAAQSRWAAAHGAGA